MQGQPEPTLTHDYALEVCPHCGKPLVWTRETMQRCIECRFAWPVTGPYTYCRYICNPWCQQPRHPHYCEEHSLGAVLARAPRDDGGSQ